MINILSNIGFSGDFLVIMLNRLFIKEMIDKVYFFII